MADLQELIATMDVPEQRRTDVRWLIRNLGINNREHPLLVQAMAELRRLRLAGDDGTPPTSTCGEAKDMLG